MPSAQAVSSSGQMGSSVLRSGLKKTISMLNLESLINHNACGAVISHATYLGRRDVGRHVAVADDALEVADLAVDVEEQPRRAVEVVHLREKRLHSVWSI